MFFAGHKNVNHFKEFVNRKENVYTTTIEANWNEIKRNIQFRNKTKNMINVYLVDFFMYK